MVPIGSDASGIDQSGVRAGMERTAQPPHLADPHAASEVPRTVTTGGKVEAEGDGKPLHGLKGIDDETGEEVDIFLTPRGAQLTRRLTPDPAASPRVAQLDALAFTVLPPDDESMRWVMEQLRQFLPIEHLEHRNGCFGFKQSVRFGNGAGLIAWGGESQRDRVFFSIQGIGCSTVENWAGLAAWLREHRATLKRADVAYDDFTGEVVSFAWAVDQYHHDGFNAGGRKPRHTLFGDCLLGEQSIKGRTLGIGSRTSGKYCRIYEKGKQLGEPTSRWTRVEVEWHGKDRLLPFELLTEPGKYLAGAYPCLAFLQVEQSRIKTIAKSTSITYESAVDNGKQQAGKLINLMLMVHQGDLGAVVEKLRRDGVPARIDPYSYHLAAAPERLDPTAPGSFAATGLTE